MGLTGPAGVWSSETPRESVHGKVEGLGLQVWGFECTGRSGLWSSERRSARPRRERTPRESPTQDTCSVCPPGSHTRSGLMIFIMCYPPRTRAASAHPPQARLRTPQARLRRSLLRAVSQATPGYTSPTKDTCRVCASTTGPAQNPHARPSTRPPTRRAVSAIRPAGPS